MSVNKRKKLLESNPGIASAKENIIGYITGEISDKEQIRADVQLLLREAPHELEVFPELLRFESNTMPGEELRDCQEVSECLSDYLALGAIAPTRMPEVSYHLEQCKQCSTELSILEEVSHQSAAWEEFTQKVRRLDAPVGWLVLFKEGWVVVKEHVSHILKENTITAARVGDWLIESVGKPAFHYSETKPPITLSLLLPNGVAYVKLEVSPKYLPREKKERWNLHFTFDSSRSKVSFIRVGIGNEERSRTGTRRLDEDNPVDFAIDPPTTAKNCWLHFEWKYPGDKWQKYKIKFHSRTAEENEKL
jgi:hypothetical protein